MQWLLITIFGSVLQMLLLIIFQCQPGPKVQEPALTPQSSWLTLSLGGESPLCPLHCLPFFNICYLGLLIWIPRWVFESVGWTDLAWPTCSTSTSPSPSCSSSTLPSLLWLSFPWLLQKEKHEGQESPAGEEVAKEKVGDFNWFCLFSGGRVTSDTMDQLALYTKLFFLLGIPWIIDAVQVIPADMRSGCHIFLFFDFNMIIRFGLISHCRV